MPDNVLNMIRSGSPEGPERFWAEMSYHISRNDRDVWMAVLAHLNVADFLCWVGTGRPSDRPWRCFCPPYMFFGGIMWEVIGG